MDYADQERQDQTRLPDSEGGAACPLTPMQQGMLFASLDAPPDTGAYLQQVVCVLREPLDMDLLISCWEHLCERHEILRARFAWEGLLEAVQVFEPSVRIPLTRLDWSAVPEAGREARLRSFLREDRARGMDFTRAPLHRLACIRLGDTDHRVVWTVHHALLDESITVAVREVFTEYDLRRAGKDAPLPAGASYREFARFVREQPLDRAEAFWRQRLAGFSEPNEIRLPPGGAVPEAALNPATGGAEVRHRLDRLLAAALKDFARENGVTLNTLFQAAWALVLGRYSGSRDVVFGVTKGLRYGAPDGPARVGLYINTLPFRVFIPGDRGVRAWLGEVRRAWTELREVENTPLSKIGGWSEAPRGAALFDTHLVFERGTMDYLVRDGGARWPQREFPLFERTPTAISLAVYNADELDLAIEYDPARFAPEALARTPGHIETLLRGMLERPDATPDTLDMLTEAENRLLRDAWQPEIPDWSAPALVLQSFATAAQQQPDAIAVQDGDQRITYGELDRRANQLAHYLAGLGAGPEKPVALCAPRSLDLIIGVLGIMKAGAAYLPLDPAYPAAHMDYVLETASADIVLTRSGLLPRLSRQQAHLVCLDADAALIGARPAEAPVVSPAPEHMVYVIFTSGSTGKPKGVVVEHRALAWFVREATRLYGINAHDRVLQFASLSFDAAAEEIWPALTAGATLVLRNDAMLASAAAFFQQCRDWGVTVLDLPTAFWHVLVDELREAPVPECVRMVIIGGEAARAESVAAWRAHAPARVRLVNTYGPTETTVTATSSFLDTERDGEPPIGRPLPGLRAYVCDEQTRLTPIGVPGELLLGGQQLARGYLARPDLTQAAFVPSPFREGERLYRTGDLVRLREDGQLVYLGRRDRQVKIRGFRIELGEIESVLSRHPGVREAAVSVYEAAPGDKQLVAYLTAAGPGEPATFEAEARAWLRAQLPPHMQPAVFHVLERMPHTTSGKLDRRALPAPAARPVVSAPAEQGPASELEQQMLAIWAKVLKVPALGMNDNFFELGGHSLLAIILLGHVERQFQKRLPPIQLYQAPTVRQFARLLRDGEQAGPQSPLRPIQPEGSRPPLFFVGSTDLLDSVVPVLGRDQPLYSLNIFGLQEQDGKAPALSLKDIAARYIGEVRRVQPRGPYYLGAYCRDSMLALEMAQQLHAAGERVARLFAIDYFWESRPRYGRLRRYLRNLRQYGARYLRDKYQERLKLLREHYGRVRSRLALRLSARVRENVPPAHHTTLFIHAYYDAAAAYRPLPYPGAVTVLVADEWGVVRLPEWERIARGGVEIRQIPACHHSLWKPPQVNALGAVLRECLDTPGPPQ